MGSVARSRMVIYGMVGTLATGWLVGSRHWRKARKARLLGDARIALLRHGKN